MHPPIPALPRVSCDSLVALPARTRDGTTIFAKNSDRPALEPQPLFQTTAADHPPGSHRKCQYIEIEQVAHTHAVLGSRPAWLWGLEHGLNEHGVAIGNHTIFTRDAVAAEGLLGMDLVRLGLERAATASQAADVIIELIERYGQGGSGYADTTWPYHNSFLIADPGHAFLLEASASRWALKAIEGAASASNHVAIGTDWSRLGHDAIEHAVARDWWPEPTGVRFDFARAYRSTELAPEVISSGRYSTTCRALGNTGLDLPGILRVLRDHYDGGEIWLGGTSPEDERHFSVCMHADPVGTTTASMAVELRPGTQSGCVYWAAMCNPCISIYLPLFVDGDIPPELVSAPMQPAGDSAWWRFRELLSQVEKAPRTRAAYVRAFWSELETPLIDETRRALADVEGEDVAARRARSELVAGAWARVSEALAELTAHVSSL
ncbi:MAG TPA: carcinine hydrolase/isopenicillin-N N-acyltransferase family protein [Candidatus Binatia bacterium]|nr:carcinine hydrolase/isopenicillin-N N-acyltransferase family protein [Candidatus Binatia bacterium]